MRTGGLRPVTQRRRLPVIGCQACRGVLPARRPVEWRRNDAVASQSDETRKTWPSASGPVRAPPPGAGPDLPCKLLGMDDVERAVRDLLARSDVDGAATAAIDCYGPAIFGYLSTLLDEDDARDVFSLFAEHLWRGLTGFRGEASLRSWCYRIAWTAVARFRRDPYRRRGERLPSSAASRLAASIASASALGGGRSEQLRRLREALDPEEHTLLVLRIDKELEWDEVAAILSAEGHPVTSAALRKRFERLKEKLGRIARDEGLIE